MTERDYKGREFTGKDLQFDLRSVLQILAMLAALAYLLTADYPRMAIAVIVAILFAAYIWLRFMIFFENDRFSPKRKRVGITWALIGVHEDTREFDPRPVRVYFSFMTVLFAGLVLRPFVDWILE